jgi:hypothetical protein
LAFELHFDPLAAAVIADLEHGRKYREKLSKVRACLARLEQNPQHPGLRAHRYHSLRGPDGQDVWEAYVENRTPGAWCIWFWYGPGQDAITILKIAPHP